MLYIKKFNISNINDYFTSSEYNHIQPLIDSIEIIEKWDKNNVHDLLDIFHKKIHNASDYNNYETNIDNIVCFNKLLSLNMNSIYSLKLNNSNLEFIAKGFQGKVFKFIDKCNNLTVKISLDKKEYYIIKKLIDHKHHNLLNYYNATIKNNFSIITSNFIDGTLRNLNIVMTEKLYLSLELYNIKKISINSLSNIILLLLI